MPTWLPLTSTLSYLSTSSEYELVLCWSNCVAESILHSDIASAIRLVFDDEIELDEEFTLTSFPYGTEVPMDEGAFGFEKLNLNGEHKTSKDVKQTSAEWIARATRRKQLCVVFAHVHSHINY